MAMFVGCAEGEVAHPQMPILASESSPFKEGADAPLGGLQSGEFFDEDTCSFDAEDPFEPRTRFAYGPWEGECHDTRKRRPVIALTAAETADLDVPDRWIALANVYHRDAFWTAVIPIETIVDIYFQLEYFPAIVPAGHTQLRVDFKLPVRLYGQSTEVRGEYDETQQLVLSAEAVTRKGDAYDLLRGTRNHFAVALRVTTLEARFQSMVMEKDHYVEQWQLLLTGMEKEKIFRWYIADSEAFGMDEPYHTIFRNCTTELIRILDEVVEYTKGEQVRRFFLRVTEFYPNVVRAALIARGLLPFNQSTDWYALHEDPVMDDVRAAAEAENDGADEAMDGDVPAADGADDEV